MAVTQVLRNAPSLVAALSSIMLVALSSAPATIDYQIITNGEINGTMSVVMDGSDNVVIHNRYQSQDKVRDLTVSAHIGPTGVPDRISRTGQSFAYQPIKETFEWSGGEARWSNRIERGSAKTAVGRYYIPLGLSQAGDSAAYEVALLAAALLKAPQGKLSLLPVGEATATIVAHLTVHSGAEYREVRLVRISGLGIEPDYVWLDADDHLFSARGTIRSGWSAVLPELDQAQVNADADAVSKAVSAMAVPAVSGPVLIRNVALFDARRAVIISHRDVSINGGFVSRVTPTGSRSAYAGARIVDGRGKTLIPGLWDMHVHLFSAREAMRHLASGVTTVRDMGNHNDSLLRLVARIDSGETPGPTVVKAGFIEGRSPSTTYLGRIVSTEAEAVAAVNAYADEGYDQIKLYNAVHPDWIPAIARATHARGLRLSGHIPFGGSAAQAVRDGYDGIQHFIFLFLNFSPEPVFTGLTFKTAEVAKTLDLSSPEMTDFIDLLKQHRVTTDLTLAVYEPLFLGQAGKPMPVFTRSTAHLPAAMLRQVALGPLPTPSDMTRAQFEATYTKALALAKLLHKRGVQIVAGTDFAPLAGLALPRELELLVKAGLSPAEVLKIATFDAARVMRRDTLSGSIEAGKTADAVLIDGDPTRDISAVRRVSLVIKHGVVYEPTKLLAASGITP